MSEYTDLYVALFTSIHAAGGYPDVDDTEEVEPDFHDPEPEYDFDEAAYDRMIAEQERASLAQGGGVDHEDYLLYLAANEPRKPKRLFAHLSGDALRIQRNQKARGYDLRRLTSASIKRLSVALNKYEKSVELDTDLQPTIYFHSPSL
jgi:hypothetical protein